MKPLSKSLGAPALFGIVQGFVAASVYFGVGLVAVRALGFTWMVFLAGGLLFALVVVSYVEGASLHQERGGATVIARFAFNELVSFVAGWAICLDYLILIAICAFGITDYAAVFWGELESGAPEFLLAAGCVAFVTYWNARGSDAPRYHRAVWIVLGDLALQLLIVTFGLVLLFEPEVLSDPASIGGTPSMEDMLFAFPLVLVAFSGLDASSGLAGQVAIGRRGLRRLISVRLLAALVPYVGIALVASATLPVERVDEGGPAGWIEAPMLGIVADFSQEWLREVLKYVVAVSAI
ncbi:MAG TPA: amino acid permease, partial [Candidatus Limnocylindrales bacterium]